MSARIAERDYQSDDNRQSVEASETRQWLQLINRLGAILEVDTTNAEVIHSIAVAHNALGDSKTARYMLGWVIEIAPDYADAHRDLAILLADEGYVLEAANSAICAVELDPLDDQSVSVLRKVRARVSAAKSAGTKGRRPQGLSQTQVDACLARINSTLRHASSVRSEAARSSEADEDTDLRKAA